MREIFSRINKKSWIIFIVIFLVLLSTITYAYNAYHKNNLSQNSGKIAETDNSVEDEETERIQDAVESDDVDSNQSDDSGITSANSQNSVGGKTKSSAPPSTQQNVGDLNDNSGSSDTPEEEIPEPVPESPSAYVAYYADSQSDTDEEEQAHQSLASLISARDANPVFHAGDLMEDGTQDSLDRFARASASLRANRTFYSALGNNDRKIGDSTTPSQLYLDYFSFPNNERWYSVNIGNLHMIVLDVAFSLTAVGSSQYSWLLNDLQNTVSSGKITGVIFHHPPYGVGGDSKGLINSVVPLFRDYGVDFVMSGHEHLYQHSVVDGIHYFVLNGGASLGYATAKIFQNGISMSIYNSANSEIAAVEFSER